MSSTSETVAIPQAMRKAVDERDNFHCRMCGKVIGKRRAIHHIDFGGDSQGMGGRREHVLDNLISLCWLPGDNECHQRAHALKPYWQPILTEVVKRPGITAFQYARWADRADEKGWVR